MVVYVDSKTGEASDDLPQDLERMTWNSYKAKNLIILRLDKPINVFTSYCKYIRIPIRSGQIFCLDYLNMFA